MPGVAPDTPADLPTSSVRSLRSEHKFREALSQLRHFPPSDIRQSLLELVTRLHPRSVTDAHPIMRAQRDALQYAISRHTSNDASLFRVAANAMDAFLSVRVHGARAKTSAFFDRLCHDRSWNHIAILAPSSVAHACYLALNDPRKRLTVIDVGPHFPGRQMASTLAVQTGFPTRYATLSSAAHALDGVDVLILGAREVTTNAGFVCEEGAGALVQLARELGVSVVVATQSVKYSNRMTVDWNSGGDLVWPHEIVCVATEIDTTSWSPISAPEVVVHAPKLKS